MVYICGRLAGSLKITEICLKEMIDWVHILLCFLAGMDNMYHYTYIDVPLIIFFSDAMIEMGKKSDKIGKSVKGNTLIH